jgi:ATP-dependent exoDNAse (exonuclease V) alpha subunit
LLERFFERDVVIKEKLGMTYEQIWNLPGEQMDRVREKYGHEFSMERYEQLILETVFTLNYPDPEECQLEIIDNAEFTAWREVA